jgi:hypothetical protein
MVMVTVTACARRPFHPPAPQVAIDVDAGPGAERRRGAIMAKQRLLAHLGWRAATIRAEDWRRLGPDAGARERFVTAVLRAAADGDGGHVCGGGCSH